MGTPAGRKRVSPHELAEYPGVRVKLADVDGSWVRARDAKPKQVWWDTERISVSADASHRLDDIVLAGDKVRRTVRLIIERLGGFDAQQVGGFIVSVVFHRVVVTGEIRCIAGGAAHIGAKQ